MSTMTWGQFKKFIDETDGVTDDTPIHYIDISWPDRPEQLNAWLDEMEMLEVSD